MRIKYYMNIVMQKYFKICVLIGLLFLLVACGNSGNTNSIVKKEKLPTEHLKFDPKIGQEYEFELYNDLVETQSSLSMGDPRKDELLLYLKIICEQKTDSIITFSANFETIEVVENQSLFDIYFHSDSTKIMILQKGVVVNEERVVIGGGSLTQMESKLHKLKEVTKIPFKIELSGTDLNVKLKGYDSIVSVLGLNTTIKNDNWGYGELISQKLSNVTLKRLMSHIFINKRSYVVESEPGWQKIVSTDEFVYSINNDGNLVNNISYKVNFVSKHVEDLNVSYKGNYTIHKETGIPILGDYIKFTSLKSNGDVTREEFTSITLISPKLDASVQGVNSKSGLIELGN